MSSRHTDESSAKRDGVSSEADSVQSSIGSEAACECLYSGGTGGGRRKWLKVVFIIELGSNVPNDAMSTLK